MGLQPPLVLHCAMNCALQASLWLLLCVAAGNGIILPLVFPIIGPGFPGIGGPGFGGGGFGGGGDSAQLIMIPPMPEPQPQQAMLIPYPVMVPQPQQNPYQQPQQYQAPPPPPYQPPSKYPDKRFDYMDDPPQQTDKPVKPIIVVVPQIQMPPAQDKSTKSQDYNLYADQPPKTKNNKQKKSPYLKSGSEDDFDRSLGLDKLATRQRVRTRRHPTRSEQLPVAGKRRTGSDFKGVQKVEKFFYDSDRTPVIQKVTSRIVHTADPQSKPKLVKTIQKVYELPSTTTPQSRSRSKKSTTPASVLFDEDGDPYDINDETRLHRNRAHRPHRHYPDRSTSKKVLDEQQEEPDEDEDTEWLKTQSNRRPEKISKADRTDRELEKFEKFLDDLAKFESEEDKRHHKKPSKTPKNEDDDQDDEPEEEQAQDQPNVKSSYKQPAETDEDPDMPSMPDDIFDDLPPSAKPTRPTQRPRKDTVDEEIEESEDVEGAEEEEARDEDSETRHKSHSAQHDNKHKKHVMQKHPRWWTLHNSGGKTHEYVATNRPHKSQHGQRAANRDEFSNLDEFASVSSVPQRSTALTASKVNNKMESDERATKRGGGEQISDSKEVKMLSKKLDLVQPGARRTPRVSYSSAAQQPSPRDSLSHRDRIVGGGGKRSGERSGEQAVREVNGGGDAQRLDDMMSRLAREYEAREATASQQLAQHDAM